MSSVIRSCTSFLSMSAVAPAVASEVTVEIASAWYRVRPKAIDSAFLVELLVGQPGRTGQQSKPLF